MNKTMRVGFATAVVVWGTVVGAVAQDNYVGIELGVIKPVYKIDTKPLVPSEHNMMAVMIGHTINPGYAVEGGFFMVDKQSKQYKGPYRGRMLEQRTAVQGEGVFLDLVGKTIKYKGFYGISTVGMTYLKLTENIASVDGTRLKGSKSEGALRLGLGIGYDYDSGVKTRLIARQYRHKSGNLKRLTSISFGITRPWGWSAEKAKE